MDRKLFVDASEKKLTFVNTQDVEPILDLNKEERSESHTSEWGRRYARVPNVILLQWFYEEQNKGNRTLQMYTEEFDKIIAKKLEDPDWAYLRTDKKPSIITGFLGFGS